MKNQQLKWYTFRPLVFCKVLLIGIFFIMYFLPLALVPISFMRGAEIRYNLDPVCLVIYDTIIPDNAAAATRGYVVYVRPDHYNDPMSHHHEYKHVEQWWKSLGLSKYYYAWNWKFRLMYELEAYIEGLKYSSNLENDMGLSAIALSEGYEMPGDLTADLMYMLLENGINKQRGLK